MREAILASTIRHGHRPGTKTFYSTSANKLLKSFCLPSMSR